jgi:hypothetical protein
MRDLMNYNIADAVDQLIVRADCAFNRTLVDRDAVWRDHAVGRGALCEGNAVIKA